MNLMANPLHLLVIDLETRPDAAILPADRDPEAFPKPIQHEIITLGFLLVAHRTRRPRRALRGAQAGFGQHRRPQRAGNPRRILATGGPAETPRW
jgi:hypothetical protein